MDYSKYSGLKVEKQDGIATVTLNRPDSLNAIANNQEDSIAHREMEDIWLDLAGDNEVKVIILTGAGKAFSAGGNVKRMAERTVSPEGWSHAVKTTRDAKRLLGNMLDVPQPIIAAVNGHAMGLGATLAVMSDITVISETAKVGDTHVKVGLVAGDGGTIAWPLILGVNRAKDFLMRGKVIDGREAERIGLMNYAVPADQVMATAMDIARDLNSLPPLAVRWTKASINQTLKAQFIQAMDGAIAYEALSMVSKDHSEAAHAFAEKRAPSYKGE